MPSELRLKLSNELAKKYYGLHKVSSPEARFPNTAAPKRAADVFLSRLFPPTDFISGSNRFQSTVAGYESYLQKIQGVLKKEPVDHYSSKAVFMVARAFQRALKKHCGRSCEGKAVYLFGSFPNGKARWLKSDFDIIVTPDVIERHFKDLSEIELARLNWKEIGVPYSSQEITHRMEVSTHLSSDYSPQEGSQTNPIILKIESDKVTLQITKPFSVDETSIYFRPWDRVEVEEIPLF